MSDKLPIEKVKELEAILGKYVLWSNMIPKTSWYTNLRNILPKEEWIAIRKMVYKHYNYQCSICGSKGQLHAHESWVYDYEEEKQILKDIQALCYYCHLIQHIGLVQVKLIPSGEITIEELEQHWLEVNKNYTKKDFINMVQLSFELWDIRNQVSWKVYDQNGILLSEL